MAWNEPGNGKNKDPWNSGGDQPPDLDEVFRNLQGKLKGIFGESSGGGRSSGRGGGGSAGFGWLIVGLAVIWAGISSVHIVDEPQRGVVLRFGEYVRTMTPGPNLALPPPFEQVLRVNVDEVRSVTTDGAMLTKDENIVNVDMAVQYRVKDAQNFLFRVNDPEQTLAQAAESAMRQVVGDNPMDYVLLEGRADIADQMRQILQNILDRYETGLELTALNLQDVRPPREVKDAFDDAIKAREDKERVQNEAEAYANSIVPQARGQAARIIEEAEAYKSAVTARAEGESERFSLLRAEYEDAPEVTRERLYLETMETVMAQSGKVLMEGEGGNNIMYLPLDQIISGAAAAPLRPQTAPPQTNFSSPQSDDGSNRTGRSSGRGGREGR
ncbi:MAG: FtsH protease activity modulator HflK [Pseudomonadota bacterium]